jgi:hypothetical protein
MPQPVEVANTKGPLPATTSCKLTSANLASCDPIANLGSLVPAKANWMVHAKVPKTIGWLIERKGNICLHCSCGHR